MIEKLLGELPKEIAGRYKSSREAVEATEKALASRQAEIAVIADALEAHGMTQSWAESLVAGVDRLSDDMLVLLQQQARQGDALEQILERTRALAEQAGGRLVLRGERLEYVGYLRVPDTFEPGWDLAADSTMAAPFAGRHLPRGFCFWNYVVVNDGTQSATVTGIHLEVQRELAVPLGAEAGSLAPALTPFQAVATLSTGVTRHPLFAGTTFHYQPDEADAFRIALRFPSPAPAIQQVRLSMAWTDARGAHLTLSPALFLASATADEVDAFAAHARVKFGG